MKNGNTIFQTLIALAVVALFILHFTGGGASSSSNNSSNTGGDAVAEPKGKFVYVRLDSLLNNYELHKEYREMLFSEGQAIQQDLATREQNVLQERQALQQAYPSLSAIEQRKYENEYRQIEQAFVAYERRVSSEFKAKEDSLDAIVQDDLKQAINQLQGEMDFDYVFQYQGTLLYGDTLNDITSTLVQRLNAVYESRNED